MSELIYDPELRDFVRGDEYRLKKLEKKLKRQIKKLVDDAIPLIVDYLVNNYELQGSIDVSTGKVVIKFVKKQ